MQLSDLDLNKSYTYADYVKWTFEERVELIKGKIFKMSPAPGSLHQRLSMNISGRLWSFLRGSTCNVYTAPFDVRIPRRSKDDADIITVVQPDICIICDPSKVEERGCLGAPDIVIEILSPSNNKKELKYKHEVYEEGSVKEYWVVDPNEKSVHIYLQVDGKLLASAPLYAEDTVTTSLFPGFSFGVAELFDNA